MKREWYIRHEQKTTLSSSQEDQCKRAFRIFAATLTLAYLCAFLQFGRHQALQLVRKLKLILASASTHPLVHVQLLELQVRQEESRTPRPRALTLRPAAPHLAPPA